MLFSAMLSIANTINVEEVELKDVQRLRSTFTCAILETVTRWNLTYGMELDGQKVYQAITVLLQDSAFWTENVLSGKSLPSTYDAEGEEEGLVLGIILHSQLFDDTVKDCVRDYDESLLAVPSLAAVQHAVPLLKSSLAPILVHMGLQLVRFTFKS